MPLVLVVRSATDATSTSAGELRLLDNHRPPANAALVASFFDCGSN